MKKVKNLDYDTLRKINPFKNIVKVLEKYDLQLKIKSAYESGLYTCENGKRNASSELYLACLEDIENFVKLRDCKKKK